MLIEKSGLADTLASQPPVQSPVHARHWMDGWRWSGLMVCEIHSQSSPTLLGFREPPLLNECEAPTTITSNTTNINQIKFKAFLPLTSGESRVWVCGSATKSLLLLIPQINIVTGGEGKNATGWNIRAFALYYRALGTDCAWTRSLAAAAADYTTNMVEWTSRRVLKVHPTIPTTFRVCIL